MRARQHCSHFLLGRPPSTSSSARAQDSQSYLRWQVARWERRWYAPSRGAPPSDCAAVSCSHRGHRGDRQHHSDPRSARQQVLAPKTRDASHRHWTGGHRPIAGGRVASHCRGLRERIISPFLPQSPTPQNACDPSGATNRQRGLSCSYIPPCDNMPIAPRHAPPPYFLSSSRSWATSCGTPTAPRSLMWMSGLRIIAVSGLPGSTR